MNGIAATGASATATNQALANPRLVRAAHEFEAQMMKELLTPMTRGNVLTGEENDSDAGSGGALGEFGTESLAGALSAQGGFGVANRILHDLSHSGNQSLIAPVIGNLKFDTGVRPDK
jgi:Rod binding domain-containing protein